MRRLLLGMLLLGLTSALAACQKPVTSAQALNSAREHPLDNFGEILALPKAAAVGSTHGAAPDDNFGEIL